ncbi:MAG: hypothetical protein QOE95_1498, partial [Gaiellaceae bacterium]|nr:hypothetical protein [Gaiellaceae bacterium]
ARAGTRRDLQGSGKAVGEAAPAQRVHSVHLVHHELDRNIGGADLDEHGLHGSDHLVEGVVGG